MIMKFSVVLKFLFQSIICQVFFASMIISLGSHGNTTVLYIDDQKISFSRAIKGASNYAHFWVNEVNKVESIKD